MTSKMSPEPLLRRLKRYAFVFLVLSLVPLIGADTAAAANQLVKVGVYENAPKIFTDESGKAQGVFADLIESIADAEGWEIRYVPGTWGEGLDRLQRGEIDLMPDVADSADREKIFSFHAVPVLSSWYQIYARKGSRIQSILDLKGKRIVVLERSVQQDAFSRLAEGFGLNITLIPLPDYGASFEMVARGDADAAITNRFYGMMHVKQYGLEDTSVIFHPSNLFFAAPKDRNLPLLTAIDARLTRMKQDPGSVYYRSLKRWTSENVRFSLPAWVRIGAFAAGIALLLSVCGSFLLKAKVKERTRELRRNAEVLEQRVAERTAELLLAKERAESADHLKSAFLATMSHELRTPLNSIIGFTGILLQGLAGPLNEEQKKQLGMVQTSARHLLSLINDVLDISKIEAGQFTLALAPFNLRDAVEKTFKLVAPLAENKGIDLMLEIDPDVGTILSDPRRLEQVFLNLLNNAVKFTEKGEIRVSCRAIGNEYRFSVSDTGIGIRPEELPGLFQPFHQIDTGLARKHEGTGLGLSICRKLVEMMGGSIDVQSQWNQGSTFTVHLPGTGLPLHPEAQPERITV